MIAGWEAWDAGASRADTLPAAIATHAQIRLVVKLFKIKLLVGGGRFDDIPKHVQAKLVGRPGQRDRTAASAAVGQCAQVAIAAVICDSEQQPVR